MNTVGSLAAIAVLLALASFTTMAETAIARIGRVRVHRLARRGGAAARPSSR
jgi:CBS domain containing-hemolysin-like protein